MQCNNIAFVITSLVRGSLPSVFLDTHELNMDPTMSWGSKPRVKCKFLEKVDLLTFKSEVCPLNDGWFPFLTC